MTEKYKQILITSLLWFITLFVVIFIGASNVFAINYTNIGDKSNVSVFLVSTDYSDSPFNVPKDASYAFAEVLAIDIQVDNFNFQANTNYQLETYLYRQQLTNANTYSVSGLNGEACLISYDSDKTHFNGEYPRWAFQCPHATTSVNIRIYNSSGNYLWSGTNVFTWSYTYLRSSTDPINSTSSNDSQNIIDNQNQNTQDIINNQNQNTQDIINSNKVCTYIDNESIVIQDKYLGSNGNYGSNNSMGITDYYSISSNSNILLVNSFNYSALNWCFYNINKSVISCDNPSNYTDNTKLTIPANSSYVRFTIYKPQNKPTFQICQDGNQALNDSIEEQNKTSKGILGKLGELITNLFSNDGPDTEQFEDMAGWLPPGPIDSILTLPLTLLNSMNNALGGTCVTFTAPIPFVNDNFTFPCFSSLISQINGGTTLWTWVGAIASVLILYKYLIALYEWVDNVLMLRYNLHEDLGGNSANFGGV